MGIICGWIKHYKKWKLKNKEIKKIKKISIRGRFAYGLLCLEKLIQKEDPDNFELQSLVDKMWEVTTTDKLGWWEDLLIENIPKLVIGDYRLFKLGKVSFNAFGFTTIKNLDDFESRVNFLKKLEEPIPEMIDKLSEIANSNLFSGSGKHSESSLRPTVELIEILDLITNFERPNIELVAFSKFNEHYGWGNKFKRDQIYKN